MRLALQAHHAPLAANRPVIHYEMRGQGLDTTLPLADCTLATHVDDFVRVMAADRAHGQDDSTAGAAHNSNRGTGAVHSQGGRSGGSSLDDGGGASGGAVQGADSDPDAGGGAFGGVVREAGHVDLVGFSFGGRVVLASRRRMACCGLLALLLRAVQAARRGLRAVQAAGRGLRRGWRAARASARLQRDWASNLSVVITTYVAGLFVPACLRSA